MAQQIKKAVILAAGLGTRMLPISRCVPKEMLPIVDKPAMQYLVEECVNSGINDILIVTGRDKEAIENHFDFTPEYTEKLTKGGKTDLLKQTDAIARMANVYFVRQKESLGTAHALNCARAFVGDEPFVCMYGDDVCINDEYPVTKQLIDCYNKYGNSVCGVQEVSPDDIQKYSSLKVEKLEGRRYKVTDMIEKPKADQVFSLFSILGRLVLTNEVFELIDNTLPAANGEIFLTDAMKELAYRGRMNAVDFEGKRYDLGNKLGMVIASIEQGLKHSEIGEGLKEYLKNLEI